MNSRERDLINMARQLGDLDAAGEKLGLKASSLSYYAGKWTAKGWFEDGKLTDEAPGYEPTLRQQLMESALLKDL